VTLPSGRILLPLYSDGFNASLMAISDDAGETWAASRPIVGLGPIQPSVVRQDDGTLVAYLRDSGNAPARVLRSTSDDDGQTWSLAVDTDIPNPGSSLEAARLNDGRWVMAFNDTESGRHRLVLACSDDEGQSWTWKRTLEQGAEGKKEFSYPSVIQARDGKIHLTYSYTDDAGRAIKHVALDEEWIAEGAPRRLE
jgi:predicted neuraminidase